MHSWVSGGESLTEVARGLIEAGPEGSTRAERLSIAALCEDRARSFRLLYEGANRLLPLHQQKKPWMGVLAERYERMAQELHAL